MAVVLNTPKYNAKELCKYKKVSRLTATCQNAQQYKKLLPISTGLEKQLLNEGFFK